MTQKPLILRRREVCRVCSCSAVQSAPCLFPRERFLTFRASRRKPFLCSSFLCSALLSFSFLYFSLWHYCSRNPSYCNKNPGVNLFICTKCTRRMSSSVAHRFLFLFFALLFFPFLFFTFLCGIIAAEIRIIVTKTRVIAAITRG